MLSENISIKLCAVTLFIIYICVIFTFIFKNVPRDLCVQFVSVFNLKKIASKLTKETDIYVTIKY